MDWPSCVGSSLDESVEADANSIPAIFLIVFASSSLSQGGTSSPCDLMTSSNWPIRREKTSMALRTDSLVG